MRDYEDFDLVAALMERFLEQVGAYSEQSRPPGKNAANGWFRTSIAESGDLAAMLDLHHPLANPDVGQLYNAYRTMNLSVRTAFAQNENHEANWATTGQLFWPAVEEFGLAVANVIYELFQILGDDNDDATQEKSDLGDAINNLIAAVDASDLVMAGTHANGWIAGSIGEAGAALVAALPADQLPPDGPDPWDKAAEILRRLGGTFQAINTGQHAPWLRADWQIAFQAAVQAAAAAIRVLRRETAAQGNSRT